MKRIICIIVSLALLISLFTVTALADSVLPTTSKQLDLLQFFPSFNFVTENYFYDSVEPVFSYSEEDEIDSFLINFGTDHGTVPPLFYQRIYLIFSTTIDDVAWDIYLYLNDRDYPIPADFSNEFHQYGIQYYVYSFDIGSQLTDFSYIEFLMDIPYTYFDFTIHAFYSDIGSRSILIDDADLKIEGTLQQQGEGFYNQVFYDGTQEFPVQYDVGFTKPSGPYDDYLTAYLTIVPLVPRADRLVFTFISTGVYDNLYDHTQLSNGGLYFYSYDDLVPSANIPINAYWSHMDSSWNGVDLWRVTVVADVSSLDFDRGFLKFSTNIYDSVPIPSNPQYREYFIRFESAVFYLDQMADVPWYKLMYNWIADILWWMNAGINTGFHQIELKLDRLIGSDVQIDLRDQEHQIQDIVTDMDDLGNRLEQSGNDLNSLMPSMPTWEETGLGNLVTDYSANINSILTVFHAIYENRIITQILTFTFLFALGGFILFGER